MQGWPDHGYVGGLLAPSLEEGARSPFWTSPVDIFRQKMKQG